MLNQAIQYKPHSTQTKLYFFHFQHLKYCKSSISIQTQQHLIFKATTHKHTNYEEHSRNATTTRMKLEREGIQPETLEK